MDSNTRIKQLSLFAEQEAETSFNAEDWKLTQFSANGYCQDSARRTLEDRFWHITEITDKFSRQSVSYQLSKKDCLHRWLKYREGFSSQLVRLLLREFNINEGNVVLDEG